MIQNASSELTSCVLCILPLKGDSRVNKSLPLYADIPANNDFSEKSMIWHPEVKQYKYLIIMTTDPPTHDIRSSHS